MGEFMKQLYYNLSYYLAMIDNTEDQKKFEKLYYAYKNRMFHKAKSILNDEFLAEDAVHEAFCKIARNMDKLYGKTENEIKGFVLLVTKQAVIDVYRKRKKYFEREVYADNEDEKNTNSFMERCAPAVEMEDIPEFESSEVGKAIRVLSDDAHDVVLLKYALGYDNREISEITGFSVAKIEKLLSRSKKKLQEKLAKKVVSVTEGDN